MAVAWWEGGCASGLRLLEGEGEMAVVASMDRALLPLRSRPSSVLFQSDQCMVDEKSRKFVGWLWLLRFLCEQEFTP